MQRDGFACGEADICTVVRLISAQALRQLQAEQPGQLGQRHLSSHGLVDVAHIMAHGASGGGKGGTGGRGGSDGGDGGKNGGAGGGEHASQPPQMSQLHLLVHGLVDLSQKSVHGGGGGGGARGDSMYNRLANARTSMSNDNVVARHSRAMRKSLGV